MAKRLPSGQTGSPQIYRYLKQYQENPGSRVFAPLAEAYRKAGLADEAVEIAREGVRAHPHFVGGKVALARALFDKQLYPQVVSTLGPVVEDVPDNLVAQRLMAESQLMLGDVPAALNAFKMLLYFHANDLETARIVYELESQLYDKGEVLVRESPPARASDTEPASSFAVVSAGKALAGDLETEARRKSWRKRVELLQGALLRVERYRRAASSA